MEIECFDDTKEGFEYSLKLKQEELNSIKFLKGLLGSTMYSGTAHAGWCWMAY